MIPPSDELRELWESGGGEQKMDLARLERVARDFDRKIRLRDVREVAAGVVVAGLFLWLALNDRTALERAAHAWLALCGVWIAFYLRRYAQVMRRPDTEQTLAAYRQELLDRYDRQIRLLKTAKYWYILPFWLGLMLSAAAYWGRTGDGIRFAVMACFVTLLNGAIWWLNEVAGVRWLRDQQEKLETSIGGGE